jgi:EmrB/QacA subfamily drug resistance transporter
MGITYDLYFPLKEAPVTVSSDAQARPGVGRPAIPREVWRLAIVVVIGAFMAQLDTALVNVGLDTITAKLHGALSAAQWVTSGYLLALAAALPICGWLGRRIGPGTLWLGSLVAFTVASLVCALATSLSMLIVLRVVQGAAGGLLLPAGQTVLGRAAGPSRMGRVMSIAGIAVVLAPAVGPTIGGVLIENLSWHWLFLVNVPVGILALALGLRFIPRGNAEPAGRLDWVGLMILTAALPLVTYGISAAAQYRSLTSPSVLATLPLGLVCLAGYILRSRRGRGAPPVVDLSLLRSRVYSSAVVTVFFSGAGLYGGLIIAPLYFEILRGQGVIDTGLLLLTYGAGAALAMPFAGRLTDRIGGGLSAVIGLAITVATTLPFAFLGAHASLPGIEVLQFVRGTGIGFAGIPAMSAAYASVRREKMADATVTTNIVQRVGGSLGTALFVIILQAHRTVGLADFHRVFLWLTGAAVLALLAALALAAAERRSAEGKHDSAEGKHEDKAEQPGRETVQAEGTQ